MKKRLMSALLALAMMLTLLPASVFAASDTGSTAAKTSTVTITFNDVTPAGGWKDGDKVTVTNTGGTGNAAQLNLNFAYSPAGADTVVIAKPDNSGTVARTEEKQDDASTDSRIVAASTTVELPRFFAGSGTWTVSGAPSGYSAEFNGRDTVTLTTSTQTIEDTFGTVTATRITKNSKGEEVKQYANANVSIAHAVPPTVGGGPSTPSLPAVSTPGASVIRCTRSDGVRVYGKWYQTVSGTGQILEATSGIVVGSKWYPSPDSALVNGKYPTSFTLVGSVSVTDPAKWPASMTVDLDGNTLTLPTTIPATTTSLTINHNANQNQQYSTAAMGEVNGISRSGGSQFNLRLTNVKVNGSINLTACRNSVTMFGGEVVSGITMDGYVLANGRDTYNAQTLSFNSENGTNSNTSTKVQGGITVTSSDSSTFALHNVTGGSNVSYTGNAGRITVSGNSRLAKIEYGTRVNNTTPANNRNISPASVDIKGGIVTGGIEHRSTDFATGRATVDVGSAVVNSAINMGGSCDYTVNIKAGTTGNAAVTVPKGTLNINGTAYASTTVGDITIGFPGAKATLNVSGEKVTGGDIVGRRGTNLTVNIPKIGKPADHAFTFGTLNLGDYAGHGIKGGTFTTQIINTHDKQWMDAGLTFGAELISGKWTYYGSEELNQVFSDLGKDNAKAANKVYLAGQNPVSTITLYDGNQEWAKIGYGDGSSFLLPDMMFGTPVDEWTFVNDNVVGAVVKNHRLTTPGRPVDLKLTNKPGIDIATGIRKIESSPKGVKAVLVGNVITLSGAVRDNGNGTARIYVTLETNVRNDSDDPSSENYGIVVVEVAYDTKTKETYFVTAQSADADRLGIKVEENRLTMNDGQVVYTLNGTGLGVPAANLYIYEDSKEIQASVTKNGVTGAAKQEIIDKLVTDGTFEWKDAYAIWEGVNAVLKTYSSESTVTNWISNAQRTIWTSGLKKADGSWATIQTTSGPVTLVPHSGNFNATDGFEGTAIASAFSKAYLVPYLQVTVTDFTSDLSTMTANLIPSYRIVISQNGYVQGESAEYVVTGQNGRSLGTLTGSMSGGATVTFAGLSSVYTSAWAHQDATYGYEVTSGVLTINHVGAKDGLGTFVFNSTKPLIELTHAADAIGSKGSKIDSAETLYYDTLQAAVNDTLPQAANKEDKIEVDGRYQGSYAISVSGLARTFLVQVKGEKRLEVPSSSLIKSTVSGDTWTVQLLEDTVKAANGNITITEVAGGTARVSSNPAAEGQTVTITLIPNTGFVSNGVTVRTAANTVVTVTGSGNVYTFVMPATSVTVTPAFIAGSGGTAATTANVTVSNNTMGTATTTAMNGQITGGSVVGVTTYPNAGYRTMGVNVTTNSGSTTAVRTGDNSFNFTVPVNATAVTVTPVYDRDNGTKFTDVWSTDYYSNAVAWAYSRGITGGQSTYSFGSGNTCSRADMVTFLYRAAGSPSVANLRNPFVDVAPGSYYYNAVLWAYSKGITGGVDPTHFGPSQTVTRAQTVTFLYRYAGEPSVSSNNTFYDVSSNAYYAKAVTWAQNQGITNGKTSTSFAPGYGCMRCEIVTFLYRDLTGNRA